MRLGLYRKLTASHLLNLGTSELYCYLFIKLITSFAHFELHLVMSYCLLAQSSNPQVVSNATLSYITIFCTFRIFRRSVSSSSFTINGMMEAFIPEVNSLSRRNKGALNNLGWPCSFVTRVSLKSWAYSVHSESRSHTSCVFRSDVCYISTVVVLKAESYQSHIMAFSLCTLLYVALIIFGHG